MGINQMIEANLDIFDRDFQSSNLTDVEQDRAIEKMVDVGYSVGMVSDFTRVYWTPENATLYGVR